jgi:hypothetical protein
MNCHSHFLISRDRQHNPYEINIHNKYEHHGDQHLKSEEHLWELLHTPQKGASHKKQTKTPNIHHPILQMNFMYKL